MSTPPFDTADARLLALVASQTPTAGHTLDRAALITTLLDACAEVERLRAALAVAERAALLVAFQLATVARIQAEERCRGPITGGPDYARAYQRWTAAVADEAAKRAALDAFERANGLDLTHPEEP